MKKLTRGNWQMGNFLMQRQGKYMDGRKWDLYCLDSDDLPTEYLGEFNTRSDAEYHARTIMADRIIAKG